MRVFILLMIVLFNQVLILPLNAKIYNISSDEARENIGCVYKTQQEIADLLDVHQTTVSRFLAGKNSPKLVRNLNKYLDNSGVDLVLVGLSRTEWLEALLRTPASIPTETTIAVKAAVESLHPALTPRGRAVAVADQRSLQHVKDMHPNFIGWHGTSRYDLSSLHDKGIIITDAGRYNLLRHPWLQYGPGLYVSADEKVAALFAQKRVNSSIRYETPDHALPVIVPVFWNDQIQPVIYEAGKDLELETLKKQANRTTTNGAVNRAINGKIANVASPDIVHGSIKDYENDTQHMFTRKAVDKIKFGIAHPISNITKATASQRLSLGNG